MAAIPVAAASHQGGSPDPAAQAPATEQGRTALAQLVNDTIGAADIWDLTVFESYIHDHTYTWKTKEQKTKKLVAILVSRDAREYCLGVARIRRGNATELQTLLN